MCNPTDSSPPGSPVPGILQARTLEWVAISFSNTWKWSRSVVSDSLQLHGLQPTRLLRPWDFPGKSTGVGCHCLLRMLRLHICVNIYSIFWIHYHIQKYGSGFVFVWKFFIFKKVIYSLFLAFLRVPWTARRINQSVLKEISPKYSVIPKGNEAWIFIARTDAEAEAAILWPPDAKNWLTGKDPDAGKDWRQEKGTTED